MLHFVSDIAAFITDGLVLKPAMNPWVALALSSKVYGGINSVGIF